MNKLYDMMVTPGPWPGPYFKASTITEVEYADESIIEHQMHLKEGNKAMFALRRKGLANLLRVQFELEDNPNAKEVDDIPNCISSLGLLGLFDEKSLDILKSSGTQYGIVPTDFSGYPHVGIYLERQTGLEYLDLEASNAYWDESQEQILAKGKSYPPMTPDLVLKQEASNLVGIVYTTIGYLCDEATKEAFESAGITGISFEEISIAD